MFAPTTGAPVIEAVGVAKRWGSTPVLTDATFTVGRGVTGLLGANGAGKTTTLGMVLGLHRPDAGQLRVLGLDPTSAGAEVRTRLGYSPEHHRLPADMRAHDLVRHIAEVHGLGRRDATSRASDSLWEVGLGEERFRPIGTMSTGQRQRVKLAQALVHDPGLMLLDEPTDGLDPVQREDMLSLIRRIGRDFGIDILLSSHLLEEVERVCDAAVIIANGSVVASGPLSSLTGELEGMILELDDKHEEVAAALRARGALVALDGPRLEITPGTGSADLATLIRDTVADHGAALRRLVPRSVTLEERFLEVGA
jgi:ABC-2 type transport system ATP-binding protein